MLKSILKLEGAQAIAGAEQKTINGGRLVPVPSCQGGGDPECCGTGPGQCGVGHCSGGILVGGSCVCF